MTTTRTAVWRSERLGLKLWEWELKRIFSVLSGMPGAAQEPVAPMCFLRAKPIGLMPMLDQGEQDDKVGTTTTIHGAPLDCMI